MPARPCRILTEEECLQVSQQLGVDLLIIREHYRDENYCPFHEEEVNTVGGLIRKARAESNFQYCTISDATGPVPAESESGDCLHFRHPHYLSIETHQYLPIQGA